ncbi:MAG: ribosome recycling factor [Buchnera aphidicola (Pentalonia nigronervosa)]|uniref:Ribosome-recycling factor n=1 Tax=Buchnera aphidicola (Pentalonia nigronervosa) TaxID=1309793 RepID=A0A7H1AZN7_9GAMM|nr:MAG: ribosome recycling factor [Buchnera aphidicola (Pentalonia nigronervosa)]
MINEIYSQNCKKMDTCVQLFQTNVSNIRTGRASPALLNNIFIEYFGVKTHLQKIANITVENSHTLKIHVFDNSITVLIRKAILNSNLGLNPIEHGQNILVPIPELTEDRRKNLIKMIRLDAEKSRVCIRNIRRNTNSKIKEFSKKEIISKDHEYIDQIKIQKITDEYIKKIDNILLKKEQEIMKF